MSEPENRPDLTGDVLQKALDRIELVVKRPEPEPLPVDAGSEDATDFLKALDLKLDRISGDSREIAEAFKAQADLNKSLRAENAELRKSLDGLTGQMNELFKAMRMPLPPRAVTSAVQPVAHPNGTGTGEPAAQQQMSRNDLCTALTAKWQVSSDPTVKYQIKEAVSEIVATPFGMPVAQPVLDFAKSLGIALQ